MNRYVITEAARNEVASLHGEGFAVSVLELVDQSRSCRFFSPVGAGLRVALFSDQVEAAD